MNRQARRAQERLERKEAKKLQKLDPLKAAAAAAATAAAQQDYFEMEPPDDDHERLTSAHLSQLRNFRGGTLGTFIVPVEQQNLTAEEVASEVQENPGIVLPPPASVIASMKNKTYCRRYAQQLSSKDLVWTYRYLLQNGKIEKAGDVVELSELKRLGEDLIFRTLCHEAGLR